jgi:hypothetical protein
VLPHELLDLLLLFVEEHGNALLSAGALLCPRMTLTAIAVPGFTRPASPQRLHNDTRAPAGEIAFPAAGGIQNPAYRRALTILFSPEPVVMNAPHNRLAMERSEIASPG